MGRRPAAPCSVTVIAPPLSSLCAARKAGAGGLSTAFLKIARREEKVGSPHPIAPTIPWYQYLASSRPSGAQFFRIIFSAEWDRAVVTN